MELLIIHTTRKQHDDRYFAFERGPENHLVALADPLRGDRQSTLGLLLSANIQIKKCSQQNKRYQGVAFDAVCSGVVYNEVRLEGVEGDCKVLSQQREVLHVV